MKKLDTHALQEIKTELESLPAREALRPYDVIAQLAETISVARARGYEIDDLIAVLQKRGISLARSTVRNYLSRARNKRRHDPAAARSPNPTTVSPVLAQSRKDLPTGTTPPNTGSTDEVHTDGARALARAHERARELRDSSTRDASPRPAGGFELRPDKVDL